MSLVSANLAIISFRWPDLCLPDQILKSQPRIFGWFVVPVEIEERP